MNEYDTIQYVMPPLSGMVFSISPEDRDSSITVLDGSINVAEFGPDFIKLLQIYLHPMEEVKISSFHLLNFCILANSKVKLAVRGNHYITHCYLKRSENNGHNEFSVQMRVDSFLFIIYSKLVTLQIFVGDESSRVVIKGIDGSPGIMGSPLAKNKKYHLLPHSCVTVSSLNDRPCTVEVEGRNRMIRISYLRERVNENLNAVEDVFNRLYPLCISSMNNKCIGPIVLVIGPPNVGKTSLCHFLLNKAIDKGMNPIYIDLDVHKNSITLPGAMSLAEIKSRRHITKGFKNHEQIIFQFGSLDVNNNNEQFYHYLIRKIGLQLKNCLLNNVTSYSGAIIDMYVYGPLGQSESAVSCVLNSFDISRVLVVGDRSYYESMKNRLVDKATEYIPQPENIEPRNEILETKYRNMFLRKYFYGGIMIPEEPDTVEVKLSEVKLYRVVPDSSEFESTSSTAVNNDNNFSLEPVPWGTLIEYHVLGVSKETDINEFSSAFEVQHFVCFTKIDLVKGIGTLLSPETSTFSGKCFIMGEVKMILD